MPNPRRRKFLVQNDGNGKKTTSKGAPAPGSHSISDMKIKMGRQKNKTLPNSPKASGLEMVPERTESSSSINDTRMTLVDKDVTASSSNIDLCNIFSSSSELLPLTPLSNVSREILPAANHSPGRRMGRQVTCKPRQHRVKVRSPKRRIVMLDTAAELKTRTIASDVINWAEEMELNPPVLENRFIENETIEYERNSDHSLDDMCRICHGGESLSSELGRLISACNCRGTVGRVHVKCLERWLTESGKTRCELCGTRYVTRRVHKYGVPKALVMWILSQNAKQLMVDSLGIMLMSPLAVLAAWLSGRTLAGLMTQESHVTPWPLASTFVLACMTLVCYYCWIVSAATRHALGWWIWYRSQYEVRLQFTDIDEIN
ncbi:hypothetical protein MSG28_003015 [Choristoneura fumiferana]|uniref:Uncharacterized protein n=1 Tax=Choristoneura fumiferana TaxID=7141 RepID=A0ACC0JKF2_CHOFU|nr:hypothetical protein MSG28_003015 [Choristoneura fumiferana]